VVGSEPEKKVKDDAADDPKRGERGLK